MWYKRSQTKSRLSASNFPDVRGTHSVIHKMSEATKQSITDQITSAQFSDSHYRRTQTSLKRYLPSEMKVTEMKSKYKKVI